MKDLKEVVSDYQKESKVIDQAKQKQKEESGSFINLVFHNLKLICPAWRQNFKTEKEFNLTKSLWLEALIDENVNTQEQIDRALKAARNNDSPFFPSIGQFITWSKKEPARVNEAMYQEFTFALPKYTKDEYQKMGKKGMEKVWKSLK